ncbi:MAG: 6-bladed beta-propeller [Bacteroidales bacterium]|nr:6-bladed beta-propeller [Bacteroidales bacterium]
MSKHNYSICFAAIILSTLWGCRPNDSESAKFHSTIEAIISIENNINNFKPLALSQMNANVEYIALETTQENSLGTIHCFDMDDKNIVLGDRIRVMNFARNGAYIGLIGKVGRGPGEYLSPTSCKIFGDGVYLSCFSINKIIAYDREGLYKFAVPMPFYIGSSIRQNTFLPLAGNRFLVHVPNYSGDEPYTLVEINSQGIITKGIANTSKYEMHSSGGRGSLLTDCHIYRFGKNIRYRHRLYDTVWQVHNDTLIPKYVLDRGKHGEPTHLLGYRIDSPELKSIINTNKILYVWNVMETLDYLIIRTRFQKNYPFSFRRLGVTTPVGMFEPKHEILGVYNKTTTEFFFVAPSGVDHQLEPLGIENDIDGGINFAPMYSPDERTLVSWFNAYDLKAHVASEAFRSSTPKYPERKRELEALANHLKDDDNPVLMVVTFEE